MVTSIAGTLQLHHVYEQDMEEIELVLHLHLLEPGGIDSVLSDLVVLCGPILHLSLVLLQLGGLQLAGGLLTGNGRFLIEFTILMFSKVLTVLPCHVGLIELALPVGHLVEHVLNQSFLLLNLT